MASLLLFRDDKGLIDEGSFLNALGSIQGISDIERNKFYGALVHCTFAADGESVFVELDTDLKSITISDMGPAACDFAIQLQAHFDAALRIIDECYNFDLPLRNYRTAAELDAGIDAALQEEDE